MSKMQLSFALFSFMLSIIVTTRMCFIAGTLVLTSQGLVPIEQIKANDIVWAMDEVTREAGWKPVVQTFVTHRTQLHTVTWQTEDGRIEGVTGTGEHPFYVVHTDKFVPMESLCVDDTLQLADGTLAWIVKAGLSSGPPDDEQSFTTYNFQVEEFETYFIGETGAWVHNVGPKCAQRMRMVQKRLAQLTPNSVGRKPYLEAFEEIELRRLQAGLNVPITNADKRELILGLSEEIAKDAVGGTVDSRKTFGYNEWRNFFNRMGPSWKRSQPDLHIEINHGLPRAYFRELRQNYMPGLNANADIPSFPLKYERHGRGKGAILDAAGNEIGYEATFHDLLEGNMNRGIPPLRPPVIDNPAIDAANMRQALRATYNRMQTLYGARDNVDYAAMGQLVDEFLTRNRVP